MKLNKVINLQNKEAMTKTITFNELRRLKDSLLTEVLTVLLMNWESLLKQFKLTPAGIILKMAKVVEYILNRDQTETGLVLDDTTIFERALQILLKTRKCRKHSKRKEIHFTKKSHSESEKTLWDFFSQHLVISDCLIYKNTRVWKIN